MNIKEIAIQCGAHELGTNAKGEVTYLIKEDELPHLAQAIIAEFVKEQKPVAWCWDDDGVDKYTNDGAYVEYVKQHCPIKPLFTLEGVK